MAAMDSSAFDDDEADAPASAPIPRQRRLARGFGEALAASVGTKYGGEAAWGGAGDLGGELKVLSDWVAPRRLEDAAESEVVACVGEACAAVFGCAVARVGPPTQVRLAGDAAYVACFLKDEVENPEAALGAWLEAQPWVVAYDALASAAARNYARCLVPDDADDRFAESRVAAVVVEHANGCRAAVALLKDARVGDALERRIAAAAEAFAAVAPAGADDAACPRVALLALRCRNLETCVGGATWAVLADCFARLRELRAAPVSESRLRRGDEASLELCADPLYVNGAGALAPRPGVALADDQELVGLAHAARRSDAATIFETLGARGRGADALACLATLGDKVLRAKRGAAITCEALRKDARRGTFRTGSYITDDGDFVELDKDLVAYAKRKLEAGVEITAKDLEDVTFVAPPEPAAPSTAAAPTTTETALVAVEKEDEEKASRKRSRGGALLKLVKDARPPPPLFGPPPPRPIDLQARCAAIECARLELDGESAEAPRRSVLSAGFPAVALRDLRARQLLGAVLRSVAARGGRAADAGGFVARADAYAGCELRLLDGISPFPSAWAPAEPLGPSGRGAMAAARFDEPDPAKRAGLLRPPALAGVARDRKGEGDARKRSGDPCGAVGAYTAGLGALGLLGPGAAPLLVDRSSAYLAAGLYAHALSDAALALRVAPAWGQALTRCAAALGALDRHLAVDALAEYAALVGLSDDVAAAAAAARADRANRPRTAGDVAALKGAADAFFKAKDHARAVEGYTRALAAAAAGGAADAKTKAAVHSNRAAACAALGAHGDAFLDGVAAAALKPDWPKGHVRVAAALRALKRPREALAAYYAALRLLPGDGDLNVGLCDAVAEHHALWKQAH